MEHSLASVQMWLTANGGDLATECTAPPHRLYISDKEVNAKATIRLLTKRLGPFVFAYTSQLCVVLIFSCTVHTFLSMRCTA